MNKTQISELDSLCNFVGEYVNEDQYQNIVDFQKHIWKELPIVRITFKGAEVSSKISGKIVSNFTRKHFSYACNDGYAYEYSFFFVGEKIDGNSIKGIRLSGEYDKVMDSYPIIKFDHTYGDLYRLGRLSFKMDGWA